MLRKWAGSCQFCCQCTEDVQQFTCLRNVIFNDGDFEADVDSRFEKHPIWSLSTIKTAAEIQLYSVIILLTAIEKSETLEDNNTNYSET